MRSFSTINSDLKFIPESLATSDTYETKVGAALMPPANYLSSCVRK